MTVLALAIAATAACSRTERFPAWAYPGSTLRTPAGGWNKVAPLGLPGSARTFTEAQAHDLYAAPDWFPDGHPPAPPVVLTGRGGQVMACGYCHLPDGAGRPENATLAGLPADYIRREVTAFRSGQRKGASPGWFPSGLMARVAAGASDAEIAAAADYFASISYRGHVRVVEAERITGSQAEGFLLRPIPGPGEALGRRIVEGPSDFERFERRDPTLVYTAYVPQGALARGRTLAQTGGEGLTTACATCHGEGLKGGSTAIGPPLAGRSPSYVFRQLYAFRTGARGGDAAQPMRQVTAKLRQDDMIALAAYAGSLQP